MPKHWIWLYLLLLFLCGLAFLILTPPFQAADEPYHFFRAFQVSDGVWISEKKGTQTGGYLPSALIQEARVFGLRRREGNIQSMWNAWRQQFAGSPRLDKINLENKEFIGFRNIALYSPVPYIPQSLALLLGKLLKARSLTALYLARFFNLLFSLGLIALSLFLVRNSARLSLLFFLLAATPMAIFQSASVSADALTHALAIFIIALVMNMKFAWNPRRYLVFLCAALLLSLSKSVYVLIPAVMIPVLISMRAPGKVKISRWLELAGFTLVPFFAWSLVIKNIYTPVREGLGINPQLQMEFFIRNIPACLAAFWKNLSGDFAFYRTSFIGILGWLDTNLPPHVVLYYFYALFIVALIGLNSQDKRLMPFPEVATNLLIFVGTTLGMCVIEFLTFTPVGKFDLQGLQGRHFIPIAPLLFLSLPRVVKLQPAFYKIFNILIILLWLYGMGRATFALYHRYWI